MPRSGSNRNCTARGNSLPRAICNSIASAGHGRASMAASLSRESGWKSENTSSPSEISPNSAAAARLAACTRPPAHASTGSACPFESSVRAPVRQHVIARHAPPPRLAPRRRVLHPPRIACAASGIREAHDRPAGCAWRVAACAAFHESAHLRQVRLEAHRQRQQCAGALRSSSAEGRRIGTSAPRNRSSQPSSASRSANMRAPSSCRSPSGHATMALCPPRAGHGKRGYKAAIADCVVAVARCSSATVIRILGPERADLDQRRTHDRLIQKRDPSRFEDARAFRFGATSVACENAGEELRVLAAGRCHVPTIAYATASWTANEACRGRHAATNRSVRRTCGARPVLGRLSSSSRTRRSSTSPSNGFCRVGSSPVAKAAALRGSE